MSAAPKETVIHYSATDACVASLGPFVLFRCFGDVGSDAVRAALVAHQTALATRPEGVVTIILIDPTTKLPSDEMHRTGVAVRRLTNQTVSASVTIVAGDGFWASAVRGALMAINALAGSSYPTKVFRDLTEGVAWGIEHTGTRSLGQVGSVARALEAMSASRAT